MDEFPPRSRRRVSIPRDPPPQPMMTASAPATGYMNTVPLPAQGTPFSAFSTPLPLSPWSAPHTPLYSPYTPLQSPYTPFQSPYRTLLPFQSPGPPPSAIIPPPPSSYAGTPYITSTPLWPASTMSLYTPAPAPAAFLLPSTSSYVSPVIIGSYTPAAPPPPVIPGTPGSGLPISLDSVPAWEQGTYPPAPLGSPVPMRLHPQLSYNPINVGAPTLCWDIIHPPDISARGYTGRELFVPVDMSQLATEPGVNKIWVESDHEVLRYWMNVWGPLVIEKAESDPPITIKEFLDAIYLYLREPLRKREYRILKEVPGNRDGLTYAAHKRAQEEFGLAEFTLDEGFRRVDVVGGHRRWQGARVQVEADRSWKVFIGLLPGPVPKLVP
ncbi:hypothetical protein BDN72DRAFT_413416 [Pluteus cervinus]|uniref:Uncharacterized protein n=1 Tax=Pluteus cervinus TaxID=181527 RepID=A0ACD3A8J5_9AGAR|nr:hypothetical protein BDN72DRAFT_413416 [Pluteus cervinus]